jgi:hypothetical protein
MAKQLKPGRKRRRLFAREFPGYFFHSLYGNTTLGF